MWCTININVKSVKLFMFCRGFLLFKKINYFFSISIYNTHIFFKNKNEGNQIFWYTIFNVLFNKKNYV